VNFFLLSMVILLGTIATYCAWFTLIGTVTEKSGSSITSAILFGSLSLAGFIILGDLWIW
jgi:hypothetical protein